MPFLLCQLVFLTSRFVFRFFLSLYLNIYLVACCIVDWECLTNVQAATDFKESSHNTHSLILIKWTQKINSIMYFKETRLRWKCLEKRNNFLYRLFFLKWPEKRFWVQARGRVVSSYDARARPGWQYPELDNGVRSPAEPSHWSVAATAGLWLVTSDPGLRCTISS